MLLTRTSPISGKENTREIHADPATVKAYLSGELGLPIQKVFPLMHPDDREFIKSGITPEEWREMFIDD